MPSEGKFYKYLIVYPFNVLSICKLTLIILLITSLFGWESVRRSSNASFLLAIFDLLSIAITSISLWFVVQKFYWRKVEAIFNTIGICLSILSIFTNFLITFQPISAQTLSHILTFVVWSFSLFWTWKETFDNVSNLFISEWGQNNDEQEIEYLEQHF